MKKVEILSAEQAACLVNDGDTLAICGCENILSPETLLKALGERFAQTGAPRDLVEIHPIIVGMGVGKGLEHLAQPGMVRRAIGSGFSYLKTSRYTQLLKDNAFEAHVAPMGTLFQMLRDTAAGKKATFTQVGLHTFVDPELEGGRMNSRCEGSLARRVDIEGEAYLRYELPRIQVAFLRGTTADEHGNISLEHEPVSLGVKTLAMAAKNSGGKVIVQVARMTQGGTLHPRMVEIPGIYVDAVVVDPEQEVSGGARLNPALTGQTRLPVKHIGVVPPGLARIVVNRAADEVEEHQVVNLGVGIPVEIPKLLVERGQGDHAVFFPEHGSVGGIPGERAIFGTNINPETIVDSTQVFEYFQGGGLDVTFLGFGQIDASGNVNVSKFNGIIPGCGGFIDITHKTAKVVFCGTFSAGGAEIDITDAQLCIRAEGKFSKFVPQVEQVTFNGREALRKGQRVLYVTERAVFSLQRDGLMLEELAPGVDMRTQVLDLIPFDVRVSPALATMKATHFI
ncbi:CoA-transferase [Caballeronia sp. dw_19]|uniref:CoA-transferase n=1 Tax=Caballeronia sp. dw_19 TaxID=2719791 RepID=UPI001BD2B4E4|nr:CoA-transferase [Caballeronia sp. dw_19]